MALLLCAACAVPPAATPPLREELAPVLEAQLGRLNEHVTQAEYDRAMELLLTVWPLRAARLEARQTSWSQAERRALEQLNRLYDSYTDRHLDGEYYWRYRPPPEKTLARYKVEADAGLTVITAPEAGWSDAESRALWGQVRSLLPEGAWDAFTRLTVFTDGQDETLAWVWAVDAGGREWELAVDPADAGDEGWFFETVLHEYCHYLTLNDEQVEYGATPSVATYFEEGLVARGGSYLDDFYKEFWAGILDDRLVNPSSQRFFWRHRDDFVTGYASTDPSEDIAESFTYFITWDRQEGDAVWMQKINFFYRYPELVELREEIRAKQA